MVDAHLQRTSRPVKPHRVVLAHLLKQQGITLQAVADVMGWKSPRAVAHKLKGERDWATGELEKMCKIVGITLIELAEMSNDVHVTRTPEAMTAARIMDNASPLERERMMQFLLASERDRRSRETER